MFSRLGRYQLISRLATGGMAEVYLARHGELSGFKTLVVVKKVLSHLARNPDFIAMFLDEARIASLLDHPNVVRIYEVGKADEEYFLAMELVQGKPLSSLVQRLGQQKTPIDHKLAALVMAHAAAGLQHAHELKDPTGAPLGLVHRDVSPQNILISFEGSVKLIDFGIARALGRLNDTQGGTMKGKLGYVAPEQARGEDVDARADIFSMGVVLWELATGHRLFRRETEYATMRAVLDEPVDFPSNVAEVSAELDDIVMKALAREPAERYQSAEELRVDLDGYVFKCGGATTRDLAAVMKSWFAEEYSQWQTAARVALDMHECDPPIEMAFPELLASRSGLSRTSSSGPRVPASGIHPAVTSATWDSPSRVVRTEALVRAQDTASARRWLLATVGAAVLVLAFFMAWLLVASHLRRESSSARAPASPAEAARPVVQELPSAKAAATSPAAAPPDQPAASTEVVDPTTQSGKKKAGTAATKRRIMPTSAPPREMPEPEVKSRSGQTDEESVARPNPF